MTIVVEEERMKAHRITVRSGAKSPDLSFLGELVVEVSSHGEFPLRWTDMALYRVQGGSCRYVLQIIGRSVVYHRVGGCYKGVRMTIDRLQSDPRWHDFERCTKYGCRPPDLADTKKLADTALVSVEEDIPRAYECADVDALMARLRRPGAVADPERPMVDIGYVGVRLLDSAAEVDPDIAQAIRTTKLL